MTDMNVKDTKSEPGRTLSAGRLGSLRVPYSGLEWRGMLLVISPYAGLIAMVVYFSVSTPYFLTLSNMQSIAQQAAILLLVALGATFPILMGSIDLSVAGMVTLTGITTALLAQAGVNVVVAVIAVLGIGAAAGFAVFWSIGAAYRRYRGRDGLGGGDAKLLAAAGAWVGWQGLPLVVLIGAGATPAAVVLVAALVLGNAELPHRAATRSFGEGLAWLAQIGLFVMLGLLLSPGRINLETIGYAVVAGLVLTGIGLRRARSAS